MLAIKINIVLKINIDSSSLADKREGTNDLKTVSEFCVTFHFKISWLASYFAVQESPARKR